ncbi:MAG TPA: right-handed parallel beta-helix repeat-containing protein [Pirellulales bacterium]|jgi:hypothetical protein|nr:right-handed parallel beta-helix repeat-containing protein [Pirellulales bacterium]
MRTTSFIILFAAWAAVAEARDVFVNNGAGDDRNRGLREQPTSVEGPVRTIARALDLAQPTDRIVLASAGVAYHESISLSLARHCGNPYRPFVIDGRGAVLDGSRAVPSAAWEAYRDDVLRFRPPVQSYQQLFAGGRPLIRRYSLADDGASRAAQPLEWCLAEGWVYFWPEPTRLPDDYALRYAAIPTGITLEQVHDVEIRNLTVQRFQLDGVNVHDGVRACRLVGVTARSNGRSGVAVGGSSQCQVIDSALVGNGEAQLYSEGFALVATAGTQLADDSAPAVMRSGGAVYVDGKEMASEP